MEEGSPTSPAESPQESFRDAITEGSTTSPSFIGLQDAEVQDEKEAEIDGEVSAEKEAEAEKMLEKEAEAEKMLELLAQDRKQQQTVFPECFLQITACAGFGSNVYKSLIVIIVL